MRFSCANTLGKSLRDRAHKLGQGIESFFRVVQALEASQRRNAEAGEFVGPAKHVLEHVDIDLPKSVAYWSARRTIAIVIRLMHHSVPGIHQREVACGFTNLRRLSGKRALTLRA